MRRRAFVTAALAAAGVPAFAANAPVVLGDDTFVRDGWRELDGRAIGIITNQSGVLANRETLVDAVRRNSRIKVRALFAPEHGLRGDRTAGAYVASYTDARSGLPVHSLYGATRHPSAEMLDGIDVLLFDIQDVGARPYTYASTMAYAMESAKQYGKEIWILDRPNPIGGERIDGPVLEPKFRSFIGLYPIPERHGMTLGELARMYNDHFGIGSNLKVVQLRGWTRGMQWKDTGLGWIPTSPNIPYALTPLVYLATGLIDEGGINNGVGTDRPFEYAGGFDFNPTAYARTLNARAIPGVRFEPITWVPRSGFWAGKTLSGVYLNVTAPALFPNVRTALELLAAARTQGRFRVAHAELMDRDWGTATVRTALLAGTPPDDILATWEPGLAEFKTLREKYLLY